MKLKFFHRLMTISVFLVLGGIYMLVLGLLPPPALVDASSVSYESMDHKHAYYLEDLAVVWDYASSTGGSDSGNYYLAYFIDTEGNLCTASLYFDNDAEWKSAALAHDFSETDMLMGGCFRTKSMSAVDTELKQYYEESVDEFSSISGDYLGIADVNDTGLHLKFVCNEQADYASAAKNTGSLISGLVLIALAGLFFWISLILKKKDGQKSASTIQMNDAQYDPFTGAPINPQQPYSTPAQTEDRDNYQGPEF